MTSIPLLDIRDLRAGFVGAGGEATVVVDGVSLALHRGETLALVGESGCGKSMLALSVMRLLPEPAGRILSGEVALGGTRLMALSEREMRAVRGRHIAMIFQEPQSALNPVMTLGRQLREALPRNLTGADQRERMTALFSLVGIADAARRLDEYPHQFSGGMRQRVMTAMALAGEPEVIIADEPTTALDVTLQAQVLDLLKSLQRERGLGMLFISHDLAVVSGIADRVAVMYAGEIVEDATRADFFRGPRHPYARRLLAALPNRGLRGRGLAVIPGQAPAPGQSGPGCRFAPRCDRVMSHCHRVSPGWTDLSGHRVRCHLYDGVSEQRSGVDVAAPSAGAECAPVRVPRAVSPPVMETRGLAVHFPVHAGLLRRVVGQVRAVDGVSLAVQAGRTLALVGESGSGKTTVGKALLRLIPHTAGEIRFEGREIGTASSADLRPIRSRMQIVFQDPFSSLNPRMRVSEIISEGLRVQQGRHPSRVIESRVRSLLAETGLPETALDRYPHEFSGGQRQRLCIARALALEPRLIVCDEPTSALDVSVQAQILNLLKRLQSAHGMGYLFITHNLAVVEYLAHAVAVMYLGRIVEQGTVEEVLGHPQHPYTRALLASAPVIAAPQTPAELQVPRPVLRLAGEIPSPRHPPSGCHFHPRCPEAMAECRQRYPDEVVSGGTHRVRCWRV